MQEKNFSIDDILDEINTNKLSPEEVDKVVSEYQKFDTNALLDEILHPDRAKTSAFAMDEAKILQSVNEIIPNIDKSAEKNSERISGPNVLTKPIPNPVKTEAPKKEAMKDEPKSDEPKIEASKPESPPNMQFKAKDVSAPEQEDEPAADIPEEAIKIPEQPTHDDIYHEKTQTLDSVYRKTKISHTDQPLFKKETLKQDTNPDEAPQEAQTEKSAAPNDGYEQAKKHNTNQLKYIALQRNRQKYIKGFKLHAQFHTDSHNFSEAELATAAEMANEENENELDNVAQELGEKEVKEMTNSFKKLDNSSTQVLPKKISFAAKADVKPEASASPSDYSPQSDSNVFLHWLQQKRKFIFFRICGLTFLLLFTGMISIFNSMNVNPMLAFDKYANPLSYVMVNFISLVFAIALMYDVLYDGLACLALQKLNKSTIFSLATLVLTIFSFTMIFNAEQSASDAVHIYVPFLLLNFIVVLFSKRQEIARIIKNFNFIGSDVEKYSVNIVENQDIAENFTKGAVNSYPHFAVNTKTAFLKDFMAESLTEDLNDKKAKIFVPTISILAILLVVVSVFMDFDTPQIFTILTGVLISAATGYSFLMISDPLSNCCEEISKYGGAVISYAAVEDFAQTNSALLNASSLFEAKDITLYGIKTFPNIVIDRAILDATSVLCETNSILSSTFLSIIEDRKDYLAKVDTVIYEDGMGISAWVDDRRVLIGSRELMKNHNIDTPSRDYEKKYLSEDKNLIYLSTDGELSAVFIVGLTCNSKIRNMLVDLYNDDCVCIIKTVDPIVTKTQLSKVFSMPEDAFKIISSRLHKDSEELTNTQASTTAKVCNNGNVFAYIYSLLWAKRLNKIISVGELLSFIMIGVNIVLFLVFTLLNSTGQLDNKFLCIYQIIAIFVCVVLQRLHKVK